MKTCPSWAPSAQSCSIATCSQESWGKVSTAAQQQENCGEGSQGSCSTPALWALATLEMPECQHHGAALLPAALSQGMLLILLNPCIVTSVQQNPGCMERAEAMPSLAGNQSCPLDSVEGFSLTRKRWELLPPMPTGRCSCSSCPAPDLLFVIGGVAQGPSGAVEALCLRDAP